MEAALTQAGISSSETRVFPPELDRRYPVAVRGEGVWLEDKEGKRYLDAMSGGSMAASLGYGRRDLIAAAREQARRVAYVHNEYLTSEAQERLARELVALAPEGFARAYFVTGGAEANEAALRLTRAYHAERGEAGRWRIISMAQAYHGPTVGTLALTGRPGLHGPLAPYFPSFLHIPPTTSRFDPTGEAALEALDRILAQVGPETVSAFFCEPIGAAALPAHRPPDRFWEGLAARREEHGFLVCFDEIVTGLGRTGNWFAATDLPLVPDVIATAKGLGAGYTAIGAALCREHVYEAVAQGSGSFPLGHTWSGAPLSCAVGLAVLDALRREGLVERVRQRGPRLRDELEDALGDVPFVHDVRGHGFLLGVEYADPRDGAFLPPELGVAGKIDETALESGLILLSTQPTGDGYAGDQTLFAPAFTASDGELAEMVERFAAAARRVWAAVESRLQSAPVGAR
ncbi:MAG: aspartate aminotransferase family protein [Thermoleophilia bacterium]|nr:aspartate aminotransferase family protein [Thermoleophilia bacterium]